MRRVPQDDAHMGRVDQPRDYQHSMVDLVLRLVSKATLDSALVVAPLHASSACQPWCVWTASQHHAFAPASLHARRQAGDLLSSPPPALAGGHARRRSA